jgi:hypothetical protein
MWFKGRILALIVGIVLVNAHMAVRHGDFAVPMTVALEGFSEQEVTGARLRFVGLGSDDLIAASRPGYWECPPRCAVQIFVVFTESMRGHDGVVRVEMGDQVFSLPLRELESEDGAYWLPDSVVLTPPPTFAMCRNWPGMQAFLQHLVVRSLPGLLTVLALMLLVWVGMGERFRETFRSVMSMTVGRPPGGRLGMDRSWNLAGWTFLIGGFAFLEWLEPFYFTQDDALIGELPGILLGFRSLWHGTFPDWNPYVFLGSPLATIGFWTITYPPQLISYAIARYIMGDEFATMEVFAGLHLIAGFLAMRHLSRRIGMSALTANLAALSFVFAGCILIMGRSWHAFIANAVWLPLLGIAIQRFREGPVGWKWIVGVGVVLGLSYHAGFPQIVAILGMFLVVGLGTVAVAERISLRRLAAAVPAIMLGIGLSLPLLLHHLQMTGGGIERFVPVENGCYDELAAAVLPYPLVEAGLPTNWGSLHVEQMGHFYFFGGLFALLFALQAVAFWVVFPERSAWGRSWWVPCGIFALLMVLGEPAFLWKGIAALPMSKFFLRYSFRFYPWLAFCAILSGGLVLDRALAMLRYRRTWELLVGGAMLCVLAFHLAMCRPSFYSYGFRPFPELPTEFETTFHPYGDKELVSDKNSRRMASWHQVRSPSADFYAAMPFNLPHYYQVPSIMGYDPVTEGQPRVTKMYERLQKEPAAACKAYGVGWHLFSYSDTPTMSPNKRFRMLENAILFEPAYRELLKVEMATISEQHGTTLKELPGVDPLAFVTGRPEQALPMRLHCRGADVDVAGLAAGSPVTINFLWYPQMTLALDGKPLSVDKDDWQRITTTLPRAGSTLSLRCDPPWGKTCGIGAAVCLTALLLAWVLSRKSDHGLHRLHG